MHPTPIYESIIGCSIFYYLYQKRTSVIIHGNLFFTYLILAGLERFFIEFLRVNEKYLLGMSGAQLISIMMIGIGSWFLMHPVSQSQESTSEL